ncbi:D-alanyl-D-alanine carboxypeptidase (penicillin-binding protein 5/6) [Geodermatophilus africanus]|uniref:D-alanyl-D-alanine carboxypeptidase (Penicillin-binding protein 5/6) n=1 Tax=Geodermatophilus africanus TaxID=1137993 RepID=A0A1H3IWK4_9ACTN|nr:serine hydrolase [Geodermatophilus africanus]SDY31715.1 D-alanyl-D-alanine carboxypeptidase (penicillin-binding protein 5/6) [Geodermatophilus africanus]
MRPAVARLAAAVLAAGLLLGGPGPALAEEARPTADPSAPTPTAPVPGGPPQGSGPGGVTVGGEGLDTRGTVVTDGAPPLPAGVVAPGWLVADAGSGAVLAARDPHGRFYPASTLKTLTLLTLLPLLDPAEAVEGTVEDEAVEGSRVGLVAGGRYPVSLLFQGLVMQSGNDAAGALARAAGGAELTVRAMNEVAGSIGAHDTVAGTPSGLDVAGQTSSPYDLALVFRRLVADPAVVALLRTPVAQVPAVEGRSPGFQIQNENPLADYPGNLGGKTGFTDAARHAFVTAAERDGRRLVVSVMGTENVPLRAADQAALLLDWGFAVQAGRGDHPHHPGRLVDSAAAVPPPQTPARRPPDLARPPVSLPVAGDEELLLPVGLAVTAAGIVVATVVGVRRAVRVVPASVRSSGRPRTAPPGRPPRAPRGRPPGPGAGSPSMRP